jgi:hypothetical protein
MYRSSVLQLRLECLVDSEFTGLDAVNAEYEFLSQY